MLVFAAVSTLAFIVVGSFVGLRILLRARRTRGFPEIMLGAGLFSFAGVAQPCLLLSAALGSNGEQSAIAIVLVLASNLATAFTAIALLLFSWRTFRPEAPWGAVIVAAGSATALLGCVGTSFVTLTGDIVAAPAEAGRWIAASSISYAIAFGWTGIESIAYWIKLRRRARIGLVDPVLSNRFALWGVGCAIAFGIDVVLGVLALSGTDFLREAAPRLLISTSGMVNAIVWFLSFTPPESYARWIASRTVPASA
jgi:hypothetical protein